MPDNSYGAYALVGGAAVKIKPLEVTEPGTIFAEEGSAFNPVVCDVSGNLETKSVSITANGTETVEPSEGKVGLSAVEVTVAVPPYATTLTAPYGAADGVYICAATDSGNETVVGICWISEGAVASSYGDGTFTVGTSGDAPTLEWTPSVTADSVTVWYAESVEAERRETLCRNTEA